MAGIACCLPQVHFPSSFLAGSLILFRAAMYVVKKTHLLEFLCVWELFHILIVTIVNMSLHMSQNYIHRQKKQKQSS